MRALAWGFANDPSLAAADRQFFLSPSILITPVLNQGYTNVSGVFPGVGKGEVYYDGYTLSAVNATPGENGTVDAPLAHIPFYLRGGNIITTQEPPLVTRDAGKNPWGVIAAFCPKGTANGELYVVDGESLLQSSTPLVEVRILASYLIHVPTYVQLDAPDRGPCALVNGTCQDTCVLVNITVLGVQESVANVSVNGNALPGSSVYHGSTSQVLLVTKLSRVAGAGAWSSDWVLMWD